MAKYVSMTERDLREPVGISGQRWRQNLDRHLARFSFVIRGPVDFPHPAHADLGSDRIRAKAGAGDQGQVADYTGREADGRRSLLCNGQVFTDAGAGPGIPSAWAACVDCGRSSPSPPFRPPTRLDCVRLQSDSVITGSEDRRSSDH